MSLKSSDKITPRPRTRNASPFAQSWYSDPHGPRARARASSARRASSYKTHTRSSFFLTRHSNGCTRRSLLLRAEWALVDEILTSENRNPLRDLQRGPLHPFSLFLFLLPPNHGAVVSGENRTQQREGKRETKGKGRGWVGRSVVVAFSMNLKGVGRG